MFLAFRALCRALRHFRTRSCVDIVLCRILTATEAFRQTLGQSLRSDSVIHLQRTFSFALLLYCILVSLRGLCQLWGQPCKSETSWHTTLLFDQLPLAIPIRRKDGDHSGVTYAAVVRLRLDTPNSLNIYLVDAGSSDLCRAGPVVGGGSCVLAATRTTDGQSCQHPQSAIEDSGLSYTVWLRWGTPVQCLGERGCLRQRRNHSVNCIQQYRPSPTPRLPKDGHPPDHPRYPWRKTQKKEKGTRQSAQELRIKT